MTKSEQKTQESPNGSIVAVPSQAKPRRLSPRNIKREKVVSLALKGESYTSIAQQVGGNPNFPRQDVYRIIQSPEAQSILAQKQREMQQQYTTEKALAETDDAIQFAKQRKNPNAMISGLALKSKLAGLLIDKVQDVTEAKPTSDLEKDASAALSGLTVSPAGIETDRQENLITDNM